MSGETLQVTAGFPSAPSGTFKQMWPKQSVEFPYWLPDLLQSLQAKLMLCFGYKHPLGDLHLHSTTHPPTNDLSCENRRSAEREGEVCAVVLDGPIARPPLATAALRSTVPPFWLPCGRRRSTERSKQAAVAHR